jgi:hypothetical protein
MPNKIHFLQIGPNIACFDAININTPTAHFAGGFWGGMREDIQWFARSTKEMSSTLLKQGKCANDQQIFSMIHRRFPGRFWGYRSYELKSPFLIWYAPNFSTMYDILQDAHQGTVNTSFQFYIQVSLIVLGILLYFRPRIQKVAMSK